MENKQAAIFVLAIVAAVAITATGAHAVGRQTSGVGSSPGANYGYRAGPGMMGGSAGHAGWMMGGYGGYQEKMMGDGGYSMYQQMEGYWNSTSVP